MPASVAPLPPSAATRKRHPGRLRNRHLDKICENSDRPPVEEWRFVAVVVLERRYDTCRIRGVVAAADDDE